MAIEIITKDVEMPDIYKRRFRYTCINKNINSTWYIYDSENEDKVISKGSFDDMVFKAYFLNKRYYNYDTSRS